MRTDRDGGGFYPAAVACETRLRQAPHQFLDERTTRSLAAPGSLGNHRVLDRQSLAVEADQLGSAGLIWKRHFDRLVDATRATGESAFEIFRPGSGQDEQDVCILLQPVH